MLGAALGLALLAAFAAAGISILRRIAPFLGASESLAYGTTLGTVGASLVLLALASLFSLGPWLVIALGGACLAVALRLGGMPRPSDFALRAGLGARLVLAMLVVLCAWFWSRALATDPTGLWAAHRNLWADWAQHLGDVASFAWGDNFPPAHPRFAGAPLNYHYLSSITVAALVELGLDPAPALCLHSFVFSIVIGIAVHAFARRMGLSGNAATLTLVLVVLGGGLGFATTVRWLNVYWALIAPQRGLLYGVPLGLLVLSLLHEALAGRGTRPFVFAGAIAGLLPFAHLGTLLSLALAGPFLVLAFPRREWLGFAATTGIVALPQVLLQQGGGLGAAGAMRWQVGWVAAPGAWPWFWIANLGPFLPLLLVAFAMPDLVEPRARRLLLAFQPLFALANLLVFQPWDWDNTKVLVWWYLASCVLVAALLERMWRLRPRRVLRPVVAALVATMLLSGALETARTLLGRDRHLLLTREELDLARRVRVETDPASLFVVGLQHNHPVPVLSGRRVLMGYTGWLWSQGLDYAEREREVNEIFAGGPDANALLARHGVDYVVVGPAERERFGVDRAAWRSRYRLTIETPSYDVLSVRGSHRPP